jgi:hypothetical protein
MQQYLLLFLINIYKATVSADTPDYARQHNDHMLHHSTGVSAGSDPPAPGAATSLYH